MSEKLKTIDAAGLAALHKKTEERIAQIRAAENMKFAAGTKIYYVSNTGKDENDGCTPETAWATLNKVNESEIAAGSAVLFKRGDLFRGQIKAKHGVTYSAYGEGEKPKIYGSLKNYADKDLWQETDAENVYMLKENIPEEQDVGNIVCNGGEAHSTKVLLSTEGIDVTTGKKFADYHDLYLDLQFFHTEGGELYVYSSKGNPGAAYREIEISRKAHVIQVWYDDITVNNLCIKYGGAHGIGAGTVKNLTVSDCEFGWIGGSIQSHGIYGRNYGTRYGNGIEIWGGCENYTVKNNYLYQIYDAAITQQFNIYEERIFNMQNVVYTDNVVENCNYSIEYFLGLKEGNQSAIINFTIKNNLMWNAGYGLCEERPDGKQSAHIKSWNHHANPATGYFIENNLLACSKDSLFQICWSKEPGAPKMQGNTYITEKGKWFGQYGFQGAVSLVMTENIATELTEATGEKDAEVFFQK